MVRFASLLALLPVLLSGQNYTASTASQHRLTAPASFRARLAHPPAFVLDPPSVADLANLSADPKAVGFTRAIPGDALSSGVWDLLPDGTRVWRWLVRSPDAAGLRLRFTKFSVGSGEVWIYSTDRQQLLGPYTVNGPFRDGDFWSDVISADAAIVEYVPEGPEPALPFAVSELAQLGDARRGSLASTIHRLQARLTAPQCDSPNATDFPAWSASAASVGLVIHQLLNGIWDACTGTLLKDQSGNGRLFLTASRCVNAESVARTAIVYWNDNTPGTGSPDPQTGLPLPQTERTVGSHLLATASVSEGDATLLELASAPSVAGAGWDPTELHSGTSITAIHHPGASWKRLALGQSAQSSLLPNATRTTPLDYFFTALWQTGATESGSEGSAAFDPSGNVRGIVDSGTGCQIGCLDASLPASSLYGKFSVFFPRVQSWLNSLAPGSCNPSLSVGNHSASVLGETGTFAVTAPPDCAWAVASDSKWITVSPKVGTGNGTVTFSVNANNLSPSTSPRLGSFSVIGEQRRAVHIAQPGTNTAAPYADVPLSHEYFNQITLLRLRQGSADDCGPQRFCSDTPTTRGMMAQFIIRSIYGGDANIPAPAPNPYFTDVPPSHPYYRYVQEMKYLGITVGCTLTTYCPDALVTRGQMSVFIIRALNAKNLLTNPDTTLSAPQLRMLIAQDPSWINNFPHNASPYFTDVAVNHPYFSYIQRMKELGVTSGCTLNTYCPDDSNTRGQIAVFLARGLFVLWDNRPDF